MTSEIPSPIGDESAFFTEATAKSLPVAEVGSIDRIAAVLGYPTRGAVNFRETWETSWPKDGADVGHPLGQWSTFTSPDNPAVIFDDGAASCSPVITFDKMGRALHFHDALIEYRDDVAETGSYGPYASAYFEALPRFVKPDGVTTCIAGLNTVAGGANIDTLISHVKGRVGSIYPSSDFISFVSKWYPNQEKSSSLVPDETKSRGFVYVPPYLAVDGRNHLFTVVNEQGSAMRKAFGLRWGR